MSRHLMAKMRHAGGDDDLPKWREEGTPHDDWRRYHPGLGQDDCVWMEWRPPHARGESHVSYSAKNWPDHPTHGWRWHLTHNGFYRGRYHHEDAVGRTYSGPDYHRREDGSPRAAHGDLDVAGTGTHSIGQFPTYEAAQAAARVHFDKNYGDGAPPAGQSDRGFQDFDYGDIFGERS